MKLIDYDQIEWDCYKKICLSKDSELLKFKISSNSNHILVDEFQDSNQRQWDILKNIFSKILMNYGILDAYLLCGLLTILLMFFFQAEELSSQLAIYFGLVTMKK